MNPVMAKTPNRFSIAAVGEFYRDLLEVDAWTHARTAATQANSILCDSLQQREEAIRNQVTYLAQKRGMTSDELWRQILKGEAEVLGVGEFEEPQVE